MNRFEIEGAATDEESVAVAAVVAHILTEEADMLAAPPPRPFQTDWVRAWRQQIPHLRQQPAVSRRSGEGEESG